MGHFSIAMLNYQRVSAKWDAKPFPRLCSPSSSSSCHRLIHLGRHGVPRLCVCWFISSSHVKKKTVVCSRLWHMPPCAAKKLTNLKWQFKNSFPTCSNMPQLIWINLPFTKGVPRFLHRKIISAPRINSNFIAINPYLSWTNRHVFTTRNIT
jgi:hypothetical protein